MDAILTKPDAYRAIESMPETEFANLCSYLNRMISKRTSRERFVSEIKEAEKSVADGNYVTSEQLHDFLGV